MKKYSVIQVLKIAYESYSIKNDYLVKNGFKLLRFWELDIINRLEYVKDGIKKFIIE